MKQVVLIALLAGAAAGAGGAVVTSVLTMPVAPKPQGGGALGGDATGDLRQELASLRQENQRLWDRVKVLEESQLAAAPARLPATAGGGPDLAALERKLEQLESALGGEVGSIDPASYATFSAFMEQREAQEQRAREQEREARRLERIDERIGELSTELGLDGVQAKQLREVLLSESTRRDAMIEQMREAGDFASARDEMRKLRDEIDASVSSILTPAQFEKYQETSNNDFGRGGGRGFFRPPGGDAGGAGGGGRGGRGGGGTNG